MYNYIVIDANITSLQLDEKLKEAQKAPVIMLLDIHETKTFVRRRVNP